MLNLQFWKVRREIKRLKDQLSGIAGYFYEPILRFQQRKRRLNSGFLIAGLCNSNSKVAIFLIYQPHGICKSTLSTCQHLLDNNYAPLLVVNCPTNEADLNRLRSLSWKIICRENFGYDFGGYQDAIWFLQQTRENPDHLLILNDSVWFPAQRGIPILKEMEVRLSDFTGALQLEAYRSEQGAAGTKQPFFGSFFIHVKSTAYHHANFNDFWGNYKATSNKYMTIRRGERSFSRAMIDAGISHDYMFSRRMFDSWIAQLKDDDLANALNDLVSMDAAHDAARQLLLQGTIISQSWRQEMVGLINLMTEKQNILSSAPIASLVHFRVPYIKKSADPHNLRSLALIVRRHREGVLKLDEVVYLEICELLARQHICTA